MPHLLRQGASVYNGHMTHACFRPLVFLLKDSMVLGITLTKNYSLLSLTIGQNYGTMDVRRKKNMEDYQTQSNFDL